ncbi:LysR family transcriptional regulator [Amycolatopsis sacchari]|uniref:DNA-binding transcriptional regulator, LysR family n=1 Tax=Amycolatopsis sacchari TaxID=115433 RepID=A0A1I3QHR3_9PSEU|nr:LysR family transcriptional regulator [Amycolatopsis sacchari]SFJ32841.1 DNA-binding transcriptional regulator, LysR family [Amycolatopsis sacchari]
MELRTLRYFVVVAEELHFGRAAERLRIVQAAVSQQIARLERELGVRLFDRSARRVRLTPAGERVLAAARETLAAAARVRVVAAESAARVRIGVTSGLTARLERGVAALRGESPTGEVVLVDLPVPARLNAVRNGELDLALVHGAVVPDGFQVVRAWSEPLRVAVAEDHPLADRSAVTLADLDPAALRLPARAQDPPLYDAVMSALRQAGVNPAGRVAAGSVLSVLVDVGARAGAWTLLPAEQLAALASRRVRAVPLEPPLEIDGHLVVSLSTPDFCVGSFMAAFTDAPELRASTA